MRYVPFILAVGLFVAQFAVAPMLGQEGPTLKMGIEHSVNVAPLNAMLAPGNVFDKRAATALIGEAKSSNRWYKVPPWQVGLWHSDEETTVFYRDEKTGREDRSQSVHKVSRAYTSGRYADKTGQIWSDGNQGFWSKVEFPDDGWIEQTYIISRDFTDSTGAFQGRNVGFVIDKASGVIKQSGYSTDESTSAEISVGAYREQQIIRTFDWRGNPISSAVHVIYWKRIGKLVEDRNACTPDGGSLFRRFVNFLVDHNMDDRIPNAPPVAPGAVAKP